MGQGRIKKVVSPREQEYLNKKEREKENGPSRKQRKEERDLLVKSGEIEAPPTRRTVENQRIITAEQEITEEALEDMNNNDEMAPFFAGDEKPKVLVTTTRRAHVSTHEIATELADIFPGAEYKKRASTLFIKDIAKAAIERDYTHMMIVNESRKHPNTLSIVKLPHGPTCQFQLSSIKLSKDIHNHGRSTSHSPELILNNFQTKLGHRVGRLLVSLFPQDPQFLGRQAVTFHNQRDFIFVRRHRYIFGEDGKRVRLQEIGPQFTMKLRKIIKGTHFLSKCELEYEWKAHSTESKKFAI